jgi:hypothetical protein
MRLCVALLLAAVSLLAACGEDEEPAASAKTAAPAPKADETVEFELAEENRSGSSGTATLKGGDKGFTVTLTLKGRRAPSPAHIHTGTCKEYRALKDFDAQLATVGLPLTDVVDGKSRTETGTPLSDYRTDVFSINVHSTKGGFPVVACGDLPAE